MTIGPQDFLANGTKVFAQGKIGVVIGCETGRDQFGLPINVHEIHFTKRWHHSQGRQSYYRPIDLKQRVNYSFIHVTQ